ncbi:MAG TPA: zf-HC2 domain-containing protein, partial [Candidatus Eisenbacteria bacterium]|nr:zf-HC2 domain-containing protein [Candidatus Eisenbacteria bacterium]
MIHITLPQLCAYLDDELAESSAELVRRHLSDCLECTERFGRLEEQDELLVRILSDEPEEEFFHALSASIPLGASTDGERRTAPAFDAASAEPSAKKRGKVKPSKKPEPVAKAKAKATTTPVAKPVVIPAPPPAAAAVVTPPVVAPPAVTSAVATPPEPEPVTESAPMSEIDAEPASEPAPVAARPRAERPIPARRDRKPAPTPRRRAEDHEPAFSMRTATIVVVVCVVVGASIAWVATRPRDAAPTPPAPTPLAAQEAPSAEAPSTGDAGPTPEELLER